MLECHCIEQDELKFPSKVSKVRALFPDKSLEEINGSEDRRLESGVGTEITLFAGHKYAGRVKLSACNLLSSCICYRPGYTMSHAGKPAQFEVVGP